MMESDELRAAALDIFQRTLAEIDVERVVSEYLRLDGDRLEVGAEIVDLAAFDRILVIGIGKASVAAGRAVETVLNGRITAGLVATNAVTGEAPRRLRVFLGGHPVPNAESLEAARSAVDLLRQHDSEKTLAILLITGGGSAQFELPVDPRLTLADLQEVNRVLVGCGAVIGEMNVVRRHLSAVKGGRLAEIAPRARQISLYISDVNSDDLTSVASGPTLASGATLEDFHRVIEKHNLLGRFPPAVAALIKAGEVPPMPQARAASESSPPRTHHLLLDNRRALEVARRLASERGFACEIASDLIEGEVAEMAREHLRRAAELRERERGRRVCLLSGGEVICPVRGAGRGGRNQEFVLRSALEISAQDENAVVVLSAGTDGIDGNSPAAGAVAGASTIDEARRRGLEPEEFLERSDSFSLFEALGSAILTGPTGNNVRDLRLVLASPAGDGV